MGKKQWLTVFFAGFSVLQATQVEALALGRLLVVSTQSEPMFIELSLAETEGVIAAAIQPRLATRNEYQVAGIDYQTWFDNIRLSVIERDSQLFVQMASEQIIADDQIDLLVEVDYMGGRLLGQYSPVFAKSTTTNPAPEIISEEAVATAVEPVPVVAEKVERPLVEPEDKAVDEVVDENANEATVTNIEQVDETTLEEVVQQVTVAAKTPSPAPTPNPAQTITIKSGQTLWRVAVENSPPGISPWQGLMAIYQANPKAFKNGRITQLMANSKVVIPDAQRMRALTSKQAKVAYQEQVAAFRPPVVKETGKDNQAQQQTEKKLQKMATTLANLQGQSESLQTQLQSLDADRSRALTEAEALKVQNQELVMGLETQQQSLQALGQSKQVLQQELISLDEQVDVTEQQLQDKQERLDKLDQQLLALQQKNQSLARIQSQPQNSDQQNTEEPRSQESQDTTITLSKQLYPWLMGALVMLVLTLIFSMLWRWLNRRADAKKMMPQEPIIQEQVAAVELDPLVDHNAKPSFQSQNLQQVSERMELKEQVASSEAGFIEQLLQEQDTSPIKSQEDTVHLSAEVQAMLAKQKAEKKNHEPQEMGSAEDDMSAKLDLARSYKEMGQLEQAQLLLQEVLHAGNLEQQTEATLLLSRMRQD